MSPERLLQYFESISEAPDAVLRLRRFILDLAVRGKLVEQDPGDEAALEPLDRQGTCVAEDPSFRIPKSWIWARVGDVADCGLGKMLDKAKNKVESGTPLVVQQIPPRPLAVVGA